MIVLTIVFFSFTVSPYAATFSDVSETNTFYPYIEDLAARGVFTADAEGKFNPDLPVTRGEIANYIVKAFAFEISNGSNPFTDLKEDSPNYNAILTLYNLEIISGFSDGTYREFDLVTRATATKYIVSSAQKRNVEKFTRNVSDQLFSDVSSGYVFFNFINQAASIELFDNSRIINGFSDKTFRPENVITKAEAAKILSQTIQYVEEGGNYNPPPTFIPTIPPEIDPIERFEFADEVISKIYRVESGVIIPEDGIEHLEAAKHRELWDKVIATIPASESSKISKFVIFSDGRDNILAGVMRDFDNVERFQFLMDFEDSFSYSSGTVNAEVEYSIVHELGHIITLSPSQIDISESLYGWYGYDDNFESLQAVERDNCPNYYPFDGCANPNSYINLFFERFWPIEDYIEIFRINNIDDSASQLDEFYKFYDNRESQFVSVYAVTRPDEDIAESFATFVFEDRPANSDTIANQKVLFFYEFPELVAMRDEIREKI